MWCGFLVDTDECNNVDLLQNVHDAWFRTKQIHFKGRVFRLIRFYRNLNFFLYVFCSIILSTVFSLRFLNTLILHFRHILKLCLRIGFPKLKMNTTNETKKLRKLCSRFRVVDVKIKAFAFPSLSCLRVFTVSRVRCMNNKFNIVI